MLQNSKEQIIQQKKKILQMERSEQLEATSICSQLNLKIEDLNIESLLANPIYRRLYNIVLHDTHKTEYQYRKNLIKQLYFLLKITPIMKPQLQEPYLQKLQRWYNKNDHKKTQLGSSKLRNLVQEYVTTKQSFGHHRQQQPHLRPQSGVNWNKNVTPFLRPYTAKRPTNYQSRPESYKSKFGQSTKASTKMQSSTQIAIRDFALSIREELEISQDFINKNRTIHPEAEPIYEQLFGIISKAGIGMKFNKNELQDAQNEILFQRDKQQFFNSAENEVKESDPDEKFQKESVSFNEQFDEFDKVSEESQKQEDQQKEKEQEAALQKKIFTRDLNADKNNQKPIEGFFHLQNENQYDTLILKKLNNKYSHLTNNKFVNYSKDDQQMVRNYLNYSRVKSAMKKQFNRKSESKRLLSAKARSTTNLTTAAQKNPRIYSAVPRRDTNCFARNSDKSEILNVNGAKVFDLSKMQGNKQNSKTVFISSPIYNQRQQLDKLYRKPIDEYKKFNKSNISMSQIKCKQNNHLTKYDCFLTRDKINPIADVHVQKHNEQALDQIQKIKEKVAGMGKKWLSTDSLMKALYIDSYDDIGSFKQAGGSPFDQQKDNDPFNWKKRNVYFNMLSNGQKKMKKKTRKPKNK